MTTRQGNTHQTINNTVNPDSITVSLQDPTGNIIVQDAVPTYDGDSDEYSYVYTFPVDADLGNWKFTWTTTKGETTTTTDEIVNLQAPITATYADPTEVQKLTREIREGLHNNDVYEELLIRALNYSDRKINNRLQKEGLNPPVTADDNLKEAGNLYAAYLLFNTYYSSNDRISPTAQGFKTDADELMDGYVLSMEKTNTNTSPYQSSQLPGNTIHEVLGHEHPEHTPWRPR